MTEIIAKYESLGYRDITSSTSDGVMVLARVDKEEGVADVVYLENDEVREVHLTKEEIIRINLLFFK